MASHGVPRVAETTQRTEAQRLEEERQIREYRDLEDLITTKIAERQYTLEVLELTSKLLKKNPEYYTIWNVRRRLLIYGLFSKPSVSSSHSTESLNTSLIDTTKASSENSSFSTTTSSAASTTIPQNPVSPNHGRNGTTLDLIKADLEFMFPIMMKYPKCYWLWNYRLWLLQEANERLEPEVARELWKRELTLVGKMLVKDSRNFHGWGYRGRVVSELESPRLGGQSMVESEFEYTTKMIHGDKGLSNFSAWHRRSKLIPRLLGERSANDEARRQFLDDEFELIIAAMYTDSYPYQQSAWFYYQFLMTTVTEYVGHATITPNFTPEDRAEYVTRQLVILKDMLDGAEDCKWIYNALIDYTMALCRIEERAPELDERQDCTAWLAELRKLDPDRSGRWGDLENSPRQ
ncbi:geranylgeranyl transferas-like protein type II alpha subunit [Hyaloscypha bicolor E]|uniref:Geranylgeranyl transferase type-2 subunit alpha n=1 Tax=Hyaloscypha bicolor E TaxID=1095630 RepID=A0A2J6SRR3_9HELO|nr:geranylgeranyl transferas-like protein type II alpha subunit [Hyaloscypha bicolor E]PMD53478.1 geranylgeranyl transferas-like protein type II alpha subunit [Hyaloscypha bicolor E]